MSVLNFLPIAIIFFGIYFMVKLKFFYIIHPLKTVKKALSSIKTPKNLKAFILALAGTLGVGNIVGVAFGIAVGGSGALFWMVVSALFSCVLKYAESALAADAKETESGGMMYLLRASFNKGGKILGAIYAVLCILLSLFMGAGLQSRSFTETAESVFKLNKGIFAAILAALVLAVIIGGTKKIEGVTVFIIPVTTLIYIILSLAVIFKNFYKLPSVCVNIFNSAFEHESAVGGILGFAFSTRFREGFLRGLLSNEAGAGTSAIAESRSYEEPATVGIFGMFEVFFDTVLLSLLTGLAVLSSGVALESEEGMSIIINAFYPVLKEFTAPLFVLLIFAFAYSSIICSYFYGCEAAKYLGFKNRVIYTVVFTAFLLFGSCFSYSLLISITDYILLFMTFLTLFVLMKKAERLRCLSVSLIENSYVGKNGSSAPRKRRNKG